MNRLPVVLVALELLGGCDRPHNHQPGSALVLERIPSTEILMSATLGSDPRAGATLGIVLRNIGRRTLVFDTGIGGHPMANFAFNFEVPDHKWLELYCRLCMPGSSQPTPYTIRLGPSQFVRFTLPLSTFVAADPRTGDSIGLQTLHGRILVELQVPTPPDAKENWPGYVHASVSFP